MEKYKAYLLPIEGKYYSTEVEIRANDGLFLQTIELNIRESNIPSDRTLNYYGYTREQWEKNEMIDNGWGGKEPIQQSDIIIANSHWETRETHQLALYLVEKINQ